MEWFATLKAWLGFATPRSPAEAALLQAIAQAPHEDAPRLALARFWEDARRPQGEYIRLALECEQFDAFDPRRAPLQSRMDELIQKHGPAWLKPLQAMGLKPSAPGQPLPRHWFHRGLIENVWINKNGVVPEKLPQLLELAPALRKLTFERIQPNWEAIAASPAMSRIESLNLANIAVAPADLQKLVNSHCLGSLQELDLSNQENAAELLHALSTATTLPDLRSLTLQFCRLDATCLSKLVQSEVMKNVSHLDVANNQLRDAGVQAIVESPHSSPLTSLCLANNDLTSTGIRTLAGGNFPLLRELRLESSQSESVALQALGSAPWAGGLETLHLDWNRAGDDAVQSLLEPRTFTRLQRLYLSGNNLTDRGLLNMLDLPSLAQLRVLDLSSNDLTSAGINAIVTAPVLKDLRKLVLISVELTKRDREQLTERFGSTGVQF